jgi:uncharacterized RDD family membrane protein YckC
MDQNAAGVTRHSPSFGSQAAMPEDEAGALSPNPTRYRILPRRAAALLIDCVVWIGLAAAIAIPAGQTGSIEPGIAPDGTEMLGGRSFTVTAAQSYLVTCLWLVYMMVSEAVFGATLGKMALGLRAVRSTGERIGVKSAVLRQVIRFTVLSVFHLASIGFLDPFLFVGESLAALLSERRQRIGDRLADTVVVLRKDLPEVGLPERESVV